MEKELEARTMGISLSPEERFEVFGEHDPAQHDAEVEERWGDTDAYAQSKRRTAAYSKQDWLRIKARAEDLEARFAAALTAGVAPDSEQAMDLAEEHRQQITATYYDCPPEMHAALGRMYVEDERFAAHYDGRAPGLARYVSTAVVANAARHA
ncbi:TipAS antibiotic-recognition domain-containing protein [Blastococcus sp. TML/M2B]|uniref:TipAS antibiotic-recognition domain-containing protein n=1 Tax=Blastococcus sp. TML/M2B TaxID=2798727 RepID=UPI002815103C|nr:TipAS antibiotic-recognition domain-containing protein [Blastococcus sp. TML/M2B]